MNPEVIREFLSALGCRTSLARNSREAIELCIEAGGMFDAVLMDSRMPRTDGFDATRAIRDWARSSGMRQVPVIALTADGFLAKPVTLGELYDTLSSFAAPRARSTRRHCLSSTAV